MGNLATTDDWPEDSVQGFIGPWWEHKARASPSRGTLAFAWIPHVEQVPKEITIEGRSDPKDHSRFDVRIRPFDKAAQARKRETGLPVSGVTLHPGEVLLGMTAKRRPVLVVSDEPAALPKTEWPGMTAFQRNSKLLVAPYFGVDRDGSRGGFPETFVQRVRRAHYPNFMWDRLPIESGPLESILRLDCMQPIARSVATVTLTEWRMTPAGVDILEEWISWFRTGSLPADSDILSIRQAIREICE